MPSSTIRWFAASRLVYATALLALVNYAREHGEEFTFGPLDLSALENSGLVIAGPDLAGVKSLLDGIHGLAQVDD